MIQPSLQMRQLMDLKRINTCSHCTSTMYLLYLVTSVGREGLHVRGPSYSSPVQSNRGSLCKSMKVIRKTGGKFQRQDHLSELDSSHPVHMGRTGCGEEYMYESGTSTIEAGSLRKTVEDTFLVHFTRGFRRSQHQAMTMTLTQRMWQ